MVGTRLFSGSFDTTIKVWDTSELFAEKGSGARERERKMNAENHDEEDDRLYSQKSKTSQNSRLTVENEKSFMSQSQSYGSNYDSQRNSAYGSGYPKSADQRSEADSGIDDAYNGYNANRSSRPRRLEIKEMV